MAATYKVIVRLALITAAATLLLVPVVMLIPALGAGAVVLYITYFTGGSIGGVLVALAVVLLIAAAAFFLVVWLVRGCFQYLQLQIRGEDISRSLLACAVVCGVSLGVVAAYFLVPSSLRQSIVSVLNPEEKQAAPMPVSAARESMLAALVVQAEAGESFAQWRLSEAYHNGDYGLSVDPERTKYWLMKSVAQLDFDAALSQANHARLPRPPGGGAQTEAERNFPVQKLQALVQNAPPSRRATLEFLIANKMILRQDTSAQEAPAREWLKRAALDGSGFASIQLAQAYESINIKTRDLSQAYAFYELAGAVYEADRVRRLLDATEQLTAKQLMPSYTLNVPEGNIDSQRRMELRAVTVSARARAAGSYSESSTDAQVHGLGAIEASGFSIKPDQVAVTDYFAPNSPPKRYYVFQRAIRGDCAAAHEIAQLISKVENQYAGGRRMTVDQADFIWSAAFLRIAAACSKGTNDNALLAEVNAAQQRVLGLVATNNRDQVELHVAQLQSLMEKQKIK